MKQFQSLKSISVALVLSAPGILPAATLIDTIGSTPGATVGSELSNDGKGIAFSTGSEAFTLDDIRVTLRISPAVADVVAGIYASTGSAFDPVSLPVKPAEAPLVSLNLSAITEAGVQSVTFTPASAFTLEANTTYFLVLYGTSGGNGAEWMYDTSSAPVFAEGYTLPDVAAAAGNQAGWYFNVSNGSNVISNPSTWSGQTGVYNDFVLNGTLVPEPSSLMLLSSLGVLGLVRRRR